jgi:transcriptional regulator with XRE-family HTH domain
MTMIAIGNASLPTTTSSGSNGVPALRAALVAASLLWTPHEGTTGTYLIEKPAVLTAANPNGQLVSVPTETTGEAILEVRRRSGLTWEELADLFGVSRRSIHHWASGKAVTAEHEQHIRRTLVVIRQLDQGGAKHMRDFLLTPAADGVHAFDLLKSRSFDEAFARGGSNPPRLRLPLTELSTEARRARRPPRSVDLVAALNDRPITPTAGRVAQTFRASKAT